MEKYSSYTAEEFIQDPLFQAWVLAPTPETETFWHDFQLRYPDRTRQLTTARALLIALHESQSFPTQEQGSQMWHTIQNQMDAPLTEEEPIWTPAPVVPLWRWASVAAVVLLALGLGWFVLQRNASDPATYAGQIAQVTVPLVEKSNTTREPLTVGLSDGSQIVLYPGSRVSYASPFTGSRREVYLSGKAFFNVAKDDSKPFLVFANQLVTKVVGTSFLIDAFENNLSPSVEVRSGKVKVFRLDNYREAERGNPEVMVLLTANQQVHYDIASRGFATRYVAKPALLKEPEAHPDFQFTNTPVAEVFQTLEESYGVTIQYNQQLLKECHITAPLGNEPLFRKLDIVCQTIGATYEVWGTRIVVTGKGCGL